MPVYIYEVVRADGSGDESSRFEVEQRMADPALIHHPESGAPVRRVLTAPHIGGKWTEVGPNAKASSEKRMADLGFTKYARSGDGKYERVSGPGPKEISRGQDG